MSARSADPATLQEAARELGFELSTEDLEACSQIVEGMLGAGAQTPEVAFEVAGPERDWWRPSAEENPHGAWHVRTRVRTREEGPLAGSRVALKDNVMLAGVPLLNGSALLEGYVAEVDATVVTRLLDAGAEIAGKAHCENFCLSAGSHTCVSGPVHNPHRRGHTTGGSSSGSAALVAAGDVELAVGGDQGGSIRIPASYCGVVGMKPTHGLVPYTGAAPLEPYVDHLGPITRDVRDNARMLEVLAGPDGIDGRQSGPLPGGYVEALGESVAGRRVALLAEGFGHGTPAVDAAVRDAAHSLAAQGVEVREVSIPEHLTAAGGTLAVLTEGAYRAFVHGDGLGVGRSDLYPPGYMQRIRAWRERPETLPGLLKAMILVGRIRERESGASGYGQAVHRARQLRACYDAALAEVDCLLMPTTPDTAPPLPAPDASPLESMASASIGTVNTGVFDVSHHPALSIPCGMLDGLPVGMMLVGRHGDEAGLYRVAHAFEQARGPAR